MRQITIVHVDDSREHLKLVKILCQKVTQLNYLAGFSNPGEALSYIREHKPDLLLLDIQMPEQSGLEVAIQIRDLRTKVVFLTAYEEYALDAFSHFAFNYLLKPPTREQLEKLVDRYYSWDKKMVKKDQFSGDSISATFESIPRRLFIPMVGNTRIVRLDELVLVEARSNYSVFTLHDGESIMSSRSLKIYADTLQSHPDFIRTHRSYIVNKNYITNIIRSRENKSFIVLQNGRELEVPNNKKEAVMNKLLQ